MKSLKELCSNVVVNNGFNKKYKYLIYDRLTLFASFESYAKSYKFYGDVINTKLLNKFYKTLPGAIGFDYRYFVFENNGRFYYYKIKIRNINIFDVKYPTILKEIYKRSINEYMSSLSDKDRFFINNVHHLRDLYITKNTNKNIYNSYTFNLNRKGIENKLLHITKGIVNIIKNKITFK